MNDILLGIDVGSTTTKAAAYTVDGAERSAAEVATPWTTTATGAEIDPELFVSTTVAACRHALEPLPDARVVSLGITSMAETGVLVSADGEPIGPAIAWYDTRTEETANDLGQSLGTGWFAETTGLKLRARVSAAHVRWMMDNVPGCSRATTWLNVAEWVAFRLGADRCADVSLAGRTGLLDVTTRRWLPEVVEWAQAPPDLLPDLTQPGDALGTVEQGWGRLAGSVITTAGHDKPCAALGTGAAAAGEVHNSSGTAESLLTSTALLLERSKTGEAVDAGLSVGWHVYPDRQSLVVGLDTGRALRRVLALLGRDRFSPELDDAALTRADADDLRIDGLLSEQMVLSVSGWDLRPGDLWWAAVRTAASEMAVAFAKLDEFAGPLGRVIASGGWTNSTALMAAKCLEIGRLERSPVRNPGTRGAAMIAGVAAGWWSFDEMPAPPVGDREADGLPRS